MRQPNNPSKHTAKCFQSEKKKEQSEHKEEQKRKHIQTEYKYMLVDIK